MTDETETLAFLERKERELQNRLDIAESAATQFRAELEGVRRAIDAYVASLQGSHRHNGLNALFSPPPGPSLADYSHPGAAADALSRGPGLSGLFGAPFGEGVFNGAHNALASHANYSIKELVVLAFKMSSKFATDGATASEIRDYLKDIFRRDIERASLSPQLSRLKEERILKSTEDGRWRSNEWIATMYDNPRSPHTKE